MSRRKKRPSLLLTLLVFLVTIIILLTSAGILLQFWYILAPILILIFIIVSISDKKSSKQQRLFLIDANNHMPNMSGEHFERYCADLLRQSGYSKVRTTPGSGDHGADIIAEKSGKTYVFQCKHYGTSVGNKAVQEIYTAKAYYHADFAVVITNSLFTRQAKEDAEKVGVILWNKYTLGELVYKIENDIQKEQTKARLRSSIVNSHLNIINDNLSEVLCIILIVILFIIGFIFLLIRFNVLTI